MANNNHIELWDKCLSVIKDIIPTEQFNQWFQSVTSVKFENRELVLNVPSSFFVEQLEERYFNVLAKAINRVYGEGVELTYQFYQVKDQPGTEVHRRTEKPSSMILKGAHAQAANPFKAVPQNDIDSQLNARYTFENYCEGESNKVARAIAMSIAANPTNLTFSPFFLFGPTGVGKTHLIQAIGIRIKENNPTSRVLYVTSRLFESQYTAAVASKNTNSFFHFYQSIDTLIIDDIQDLHGKPGTQNTFFHIFNHLHQNNKQIIMSSDCAPAEMEGFETRMLSRFKWGMAVEMSLPDYELRRKVLLQKTQQDGLDIPTDVIDYVASNTTTIRELEGIVASIIGHATLLNSEINLELARTLVANAVKVSKKPINFEVIAEEVCSFYNIDIDLLFTKTRKREVSDARQIVMYLAKKLAKMPLVDIGHRIDRTHATVNYACNAIQERLPIDKLLQADISRIEAAITGVPVQ